uniref:HTH_Tnp_Tc3_1 domain-containing protein n=1 Tax=Panagrellus redivivus TaxID=6233 RepID=A0A7E4VWM6_PANRE
MNFEGLPLRDVAKLMLVKSEKLNHRSFKGVENLESGKCKTRDRPINIVKGCKLAWNIDQHRIFDNLDGDSVKGRRDGRMTVSDDEVTVCWGRRVMLHGVTSWLIDAFEVVIF